jgi:hypothetical protein
VVRRRQTLLGFLAALAAALGALVWPAARPGIANRPRRRLTPAVVASDPPLGGGPVPPTQTLELATTTERGVDPARARLSPPVPGTWRWCADDRLCFAPTAPLPMGATETLRLPLRVHAGNHIASQRRQARTTTFTMTFRVARASVGLAQVLLADLDYLPLRSATTLGARPTDSAAIDAALTPTRAGESDSGARLADTLEWRWPSVPASLRALWSPGQNTVLTAGAIVQFERVEGLASGGYPPYRATLTPAFWHALLTAALAGRRDPDDYAYAMVSEQAPERLVLWSDGHDALSTLVNTGITGGATPTGTWAVYLRYPEQTMRGTTVTGQHYVYPDVKDVSYFEGNFAVHAFARAHYGFPQSQGCVEVPPTIAPKIYDRLHYGSLVTISG